MRLTLKLKKSDNLKTKGLCKLSVQTLAKFVLLTQNYTTILMHKKMNDFDLKTLLDSRFGENYALHDKYMNKTLATVLHTIGFDKCYKSAKGAYLYDADGNEYLDFISGYGVYGMGRNNPTIAKALKDAIDLDLSNMVQLDCAQLSGLLAEKIVHLHNNKLSAVFFCNSGTEANEGAIKFARAHTKKTRIISMDGGYHGLTYGTLSLTITPHFQKGFEPFLPGAEMIKFNDLEDLENKLKQGDVAAFIAEPVIGHGVNIPSADFFPKAQELCHKYGALFIMDEVQTGLGRTGKMFAYQHWNLEPDIVTMAKALSGGYVPAGAFITTREIHQSVFSTLENCVKHSTTFGRNNLAMVCGLATIHVLENDGLVENCAKMGKLLIQKLDALKEKHSYIKEVRGLGLMIAIEFQEPKGILQKAAWKALKAANNSLFTQMIVTALMDNYRIITQVTSHEVHAVKLLPPFVITEAEIDKFVKAFDETLTAASNPTGSLWKFGKRLISASIANKEQKQ